MKKTVYLAGAIGGLVVNEAEEWRDKVTNQLYFDGIYGISPLRLEPLPVDNTYAYNGDIKEIGGTPAAITNKNIFDIRNCDIILAYLPIPKEGQRQSWGTLMEISAAYILGKPIILVSNDPDVIDYPLVRHMCGWITKDLEEGIEIIYRLLKDYV